MSVQKTQLTAKVSLRLERRERVAAERELAVAAALRRAHVSTPVAAPHDEAARHQVDVVPAQGPQLADAQPGPYRQGEHRAPLGIGCVEEPLGLVKGEEVELRLRSLQPAHLGHVREQLPVDRDRERLAQHGEVIVERLRLEPGGELLRLVGFDVAHPDLVEPVATECSARDGMPAAIAPRSGTPADAATPSRSLIRRCR